MKTLTLPMCCLFFASAVAAAQTFSVNLGGGNAAASNAKATASDEVKSLGRGVGVNETEALKDAYRDAIERAIGLYVDAETVAKNDEIVKDQILTQSNAYITRCDKVKTSRLNGGLVEVRIVATIKKRALTKKVTDAIPGVTFNLGQGMQNLHAEIASKDKRNVDAAALLRNALKDVDPIRQLMKPKICIETQQIIKGPVSDHDMYWFANGAGISDNQVGVSYVFKIELDREKYFKGIVPKLKAVLEQISLETPREFRLSSRPLDLQQQYFYDYDSFQKGAKGYCHNKGFYYPVISMKGSINGNMVSFAPSLKNCSSVHWSGYDCDLGFYIGSASIRTPQRNEIYLSLFSIITELNDRSTHGKAEQYLLDKESAKVVNEWFIDNGCEDELDHNAPSIVYNVIFLDDKENEILVKPWKIRRYFLMNFGSDVYYPNKPGSGPGREKKKMWRNPDIPAKYAPAGVFYSTPFVGCAGESFMQWQDFVFHKDDLAKIKQVRIELAE